MKIMQHPWTRYVSIGDSFAEGVGDDEPSLPNGVRGWSDRVAEELSKSVDDFAYANLAIRGRLLEQIRDEQAEAALALKPDLISVSAGGNNIIRPGAGPDAVAADLEDLVRTLSRDGATVVFFNGPDIGKTPVLRQIRGRVGIYNSNLNGVATRTDSVVVDLWNAKHLQEARMWAPDRLHFSPTGHHEIAILVLNALGVDHSLTHLEPEPLPHQSWRQARASDITWAREHLGPWVVRRLTGKSSGDTISPKRPDALPIRTDRSPS